MPSRRTHQKTHNGCTICKRRKVKVSMPLRPSKLFPTCFCSVTELSLAAATAYAMALLVASPTRHPIIRRIMRRLHLLDSPAILVPYATKTQARNHLSSPTPRSQYREPVRVYPHYRSAILAAFTPAWSMHLVHWQTSTCISQN